MHYAMAIHHPRPERSREPSAGHRARVVPPGILRDTIGAAPPTGDSLSGVNPEREGFVCSDKRP